MRRPLRSPRPRGPASSHWAGVLVAAVLGGAPAAASPQPPSPVLPEGLGTGPLSTRIDALLDEPSFRGMQWGVLVMDPSAPSPELATLYERNSTLRLIPASSAKIPVAVAALGLLGPDYRWDTGFYASAFPQAGVLSADLYLVGTGDPTLGEPYYDPPDRALQGLVDSLLAAGVRRVEGNLILDASAWDSTTVPENWMVEDLPGPAGATGGAFAVREGLLEVRVRGAAIAGDAAEVEWAPRGRADFVENRVSTAAAGTFRDIEESFLPESRRWVVSGQVPPGDSVLLKLPQRDPVRLAMDALWLAVAQAGITVQGSPLIVWDAGALLEGGCLSGAIPSCPVMHRIAGQHSPPLSRVVAPILAESHNWMAEQLVRTLGVASGGRGSWTDGIEVVQAYLEDEVGVPPLDVHLRDGSGLAANNLLTARAVALTLLHAREAPWGSTVREALAQPGWVRSTLEYRLRGMEGRVFAKTGTIRHVNALSGYVTTDDGRDLVFSILTNGSNLPTAVVRDRIDQIVRALAAP